MDDLLYELLFRCTPRITAGRDLGTGFFVAPGAVLTCAHVVADAVRTNERIVLHHEQRALPATVDEFRSTPYPDLALLRVDFADHHYLTIDPEIQAGDDLFVYGYPPNFPGGDAVTAVYEGPAWLDAAKSQRLLKFKQAQIVPGLSGAPLVNLRTFGVCGVVKSTRDRHSDLGGRAVPIDVARDLFRLFPPPDRRWSEAIRLSRTAGRPSPPAQVAVVRYDSAENTLNRPARLFGRDAVGADIDRRLDRGGTVLLHGMAGSGKTALAATIADRRVSRGAGPYLWLRVGHADTETVLDAIARFVGKAEAEPGDGDARVLAIRQAIGRSGVTLVVLDDAWDGTAVHAALRAIPPQVAVMVTSRTRFALEHLVEVASLATADALDLLASSAGRTQLWLEPDAAALCKELGNHSYALEIAGRHLRHYGISVRELRELIGASPDRLAMPEGAGAEDRRSLSALLDQSYAALPDEDSRMLFRAAGTLPSPGATAELWAILLQFDPARARRALTVLLDLSLVRTRAGTHYFEMHDLTFAYARQLAGAHPGSDALRARLVPAVRQFVKANENRDALIATDIDNVLAAAARARSADRSGFVEIMAVLALSGYLDNHGHSPGFVHLLDAAIDTVRAGPPARDDLLHLLLSKRGNIHFDRGEFADALNAYETALTLTAEPQRHAVINGVMGKVLIALGRPEDAAAAFRRAYRIADESGDEYGRLRVLEQHSIAAFHRGEYDAAVDLATDGIALSRRLGAPHYEAIFLNNRGSAEYDRGVRAALQWHTEALRIAAELRDEDALALTHNALAVDYHALEDVAGARQHLTEALRLYRKIGQRTNEARVRTMIETFGYRIDLGEQTS